MYSRSLSSPSFDGQSFEGLPQDLFVIAEGFGKNRENHIFDPILVDPIQEESLADLK
jgi:hypothetical protein